MSTFELVGTLNKVRDTEKFQGYEEKLSSKGYKGRNLRFNCVSGNNKILLSLDSWVKEDGVVYTFSKPTSNGKGELLNIPFKDRFNPDLTAQVAEFKKNVLDLSEPNNEDKKRSEYISEWDFIEAIHSLLDNEVYKNRVFKIRGVVESRYNAEKEKWYTSYIPQRIYLVDDNTTQMSRMSVVVYFNKDDWDDAGIDETGKAYINGYTLEYDNQSKKNLPCPISIAVLKGETDNAKKVFELVKRRFAVRDNSWKECGLVAEIINGSSTVELTYDMLTDNQKELIDLGLATLDDIRKEEGNIYGDIVREYRFYTFGRGYSNGAKDTVYEDKDFVIQSNTSLIDETTGEVIDNIEDLFE